MNAKVLVITTISDFLFFNPDFKNMFGDVMSFLFPSFSDLDHTADVQ